MNIPDNYDRWKKHDAEQQAELEKYPVCCNCENHIQDDYLYNIHGEIFCEDCVNTLFAEEVEDYIIDYEND